MLLELLSGKEMASGKSWSIYGKDIYDKDWYDALFIERLKGRKV